MVDAKINSLLFKNLLFKRSEYWHKINLNGWRHAFGEQKLYTG